MSTRCSRAIPAIRSSPRSMTEPSSALSPYTTLFRSWGCEILTASQQTKYVLGVHTDANGVVKATVQGIATVVNNRAEAQLPEPHSPTQPTCTQVAGQTQDGWRCGAAGDGTAVSPQDL